MMVATMLHHILVLQLILFPILTLQQGLVLFGDAKHQDNYISLTASGSSASTGRFYFNKPLHLLDPKDPSQVVSFSTQFTFKIQQGSNVGEGFAFIMTPEISAPPPGSQGSYLGLINASRRSDLSNHLFAIEFDTHQDLEFQDPGNPHIGIDVNDLKSVEVIVPPDDLMLDQNFMLTAFIDYTSSNHMLQVRLSRNTTKPKGDPLLIWSPNNLSNVMRQAMYMGFSGSTNGDLADESHFIYSWQLSIANSAITSVVDMGIPSFSTAAAPDSTKSAAQNMHLMPVLGFFSFLFCIIALL